MQSSAVFQQHGSSEIIPAHYAEYYAKGLLNTLYGQYVEFSLSQEDTSFQDIHGETMTEATQQYLLAKNAALKIFLAADDNTPQAIKNDDPTLHQLANAVLEYARELTYYRDSNTALFQDYLSATCGR